MKNKLTIAGIVLALVFICFFGYKGYDNFINNDEVGEDTAKEDNTTIYYENIATENESTKENENIENIENNKKDKGLSHEEFVTGDGETLAHDSDLSSTIEKSDEKNQVVAVETALNIVNPTLNLDAASALLMDAETGKVIFHKNATDRVYPASTVKLMTALVALDKCDKEEKITVGDEISLMAIDSSRAYLNKGEKLTLKMLLEGLLLPSGNDAAYSIAAYVGRKVSTDNTMSASEAVNVFVNLMNEKAKDLGLKNTHFMNPDGYDHDEQYTTAYDMAIIAKEALNNELICSITKMQRARNIFLSGEDVTWKSGNKLISAGSGVFYKYAIGLKSGTSSLAGRCMVSAAKKENKTYISVVMNSTAEGRWEDSLTLLKYGIEN